MKLKTLSDKDWQYNAAGLEEAYHLVFYLRNKDDVTGWTTRVSDFKHKSNEADYQLIKEMTVDAFSNSGLKFDYVIRVLGHDEKVAQSSAPIIDYVKAIASVTDAIYIPQLLNKHKKTRPLHTLYTKVDRQNEMKDVFFVKNDENDLNNKKILIIDDISTSCTTVAEMIKTIKAKWPRAQCYLFCLARTSYDPNANKNI
ncbi:phosphoribosyltransferase [Bacteroides fragilis]|uniref:phosphoribosyltransferase n=1 Tax=Bacteroides fragilis TaxID=817 RepID=UPI00202FD2BF|nr:hypothetical protein [Bacteroides fragilis]MCM0347364.1 hypothetical protein [Bacteroides fragilis]